MPYKIYAEIIDPKTGKREPGTGALRDTVDSKEMAIAGIRALSKQGLTAHAVGDDGWSRDSAVSCPSPAFPSSTACRARTAKKLGDTWFAFDDSRPLAFFAGIWASQWTSVRKVREGMVTIDLFAFLTTTPNDVVGAIHPKAMPVILTTPEEIETWMTAPWSEARKLQRPLPDGVLRIVARGAKEEGPSGN